MLLKFLANIPNLSSLLLVGGNPISDDVQKLKSKGGNIIIGTPGRIEELLTKNFPEIQFHRSLKELVILN